MNKVSANINQHSFQSVKGAPCYTHCRRFLVGNGISSESADELCFASQLSFRFPIKNNVNYYHVETRGQNDTMKFQ